MGHVICLTVSASFILMGAITGFMALLSKALSVILWGGLVVSPAGQ